jgi:hypothetical protein
MNTVLTVSFEVDPAKIRKTGGAIKIASCGHLSQVEELMAFSLIAQ